MTMEPVSRDSDTTVSSHDDGKTQPSTVATSLSRPITFSRLPEPSETIPSQESAEIAQTDSLSSEMAKETAVSKLVYEVANRRFEDRETVNALVIRRGAIKLLLVLHDRHEIERSEFVELVEDDNDWIDLSHLLQARVATWIGNRLLITNKGERVSQLLKDGFSSI